MVCQCVMPGIAETWRTHKPKVSVNSLSFVSTDQQYKEHIQNPTNI